MMNEKINKEKLYNILYDIRPECDFRNSSNYIEDVLLDSLDILDFVSAIEEELRITVAPGDIVPENFKTVETVMKLMRKYEEE